MGALAHEIDPERIGVARAGFSKSNPLEPRDSKRLSGQGT